MRRKSMKDVDALIKKCDYGALLEKCKNKKNIKKIAHIMFKIGVLESDITSYASACYLADNLSDYSEKAEFHHTASIILTNGFTYLEGAYTLAYTHFMKATEYDPDCLIYKRAILLTFSDHPDFDFDPAIQKRIAMDIIKINPDDDVARKFIES